MPCCSANSSKLAADFYPTIPWCSRPCDRPWELSKAVRSEFLPSRSFLSTEEICNAERWKAVFAPRTRALQEFFSEQIILDPNCKEKVEFTRQSQEGWTSQAEERPWARAGQCESARQSHRMGAKLWRLRVLRRKGKGRRWDDNVNYPLAGSRMGKRAIVLPMQSPCADFPLQIK